MIKRLVKRILSRLRELVLHWTRTSSLFAAFYIWWVTFAVKHFIRKKNAYTALDWLLNAVRRIPDLNKTKHLRELARAIIQERCCDAEGNFLPHEQNKLYDDFLQSSKFAPARNEFANQPIEERRRLRYYRENQGIERQGNLIMLKPFNAQTGEKGVLVCKYNTTASHLAAAFDLRKLLQNYRIVFEPSFHRNIEPDLFLYNGQGFRQVFQCVQEADAAVLGGVPHCFELVPTVSADYIDTEIFNAPAPGTVKEYDLAMVASWLKIKRHRAVMKGLGEWKKIRPDFKAVFVGYPFDLHLTDIQKFARQYGVESNCTFFERIPSSQVSEILQKSRMSINFSEYEGMPKACYESLFCDVPLIVYKHNHGFRLSWINEKTGMLADDNELAAVMEYIRTHSEQFSPREFVSSRAGYENATRILNDALKKTALENGEPWTLDIAAKKNGSHLVPNYITEADRLAMEPHYADLEQYLS